MRHIQRVSPVLVVLPFLLALVPVRSLASSVPPGFMVQVLIDGRPVPEYRTPGVQYIEALKGREYAIRLHNPLDVRVAVALSVDGLNTIDARRTTAREARKWVLGPHETITISGWQTSMEQARRFFFTTEEKSYAARLGQSDNLGVISAVFFRERSVPVVALLESKRDQEDRARPQGMPAPPASAGEAGGAGAASRKEASRPAQPAEYAATGIGDRADNQVTLVHLDLEDRPSAALNLRYEYRAQLARLGVLPLPPVVGDPLDRRQQAIGFCPDIR